MANEQFAELIERATLAGKSLDEIDEEIIEPAVLSQPQKGALLLFAYSLRLRSEQRRYARESLAMTGIPLSEPVSDTAAEPTRTTPRGSPPSRAATFRARSSARPAIRDPRGSDVRRARHFH